ncbi:MAG: ATP-binding protein, partial [Opitutaceae bacterium]
AAGLTRQLLVFSRQQVVQIKTLNLCDVVSGLTKMLRRLLGEDIELVSSVGLRPLFIEADMGMMEQVIMNLCLNARDAMPKGGILKIELDQVEIAESSMQTDPQSRPGQFVRMKVSDTGCGISEKDLPHIFEPFFTTKDTGKGTGLGLATVYGIVTEHKGWISVESSIGYGAIFGIYLPSSVKSTSLQQVDKIEPACEGTETILLVEDDAIVRSMIKQCLQSFGYHVLEAINGREALRLWPDLCDKVDLLLTDLIMPEGMTGLDLTAKLRATKPDLRVIISSGYGASLISDDILKTSGARYLAKPFAASTLAATVRESLASV